MEVNYQNAKAFELSVKGLRACGWSEDEIAKEFSTTAEIIELAAGESHSKAQPSKQSQRQRKRQMPGPKPGPKLRALDALEIGEALSSKDSSGAVSMRVVSAHKRFAPKRFRTVRHNGTQWIIRVA